MVETWVLRHHAAWRQSASLLLHSLPRQKVTATFSVLAPCDHFPVIHFTFDDYRAPEDSVTCCAQSNIKDAQSQRTLLMDLECIQHMERGGVKHVIGIIIANGWSPLKLISHWEGWKLSLSTLGPWQTVPPMSFLFNNSCQRQCNAFRNVNDSIRPNPKQKPVVL